MLHGIFSAKKISKVGPEIYGGYVASILKPKKFNTYKADVSCIYLLIYSFIYSAFLFFHYQCYGFWTLKRE